MDFIKALDISSSHSSVCCAGEWLPAGDVFASFNPATGAAIARVSLCGAADYERVMQSASQAFARWRLEPAPRRGELVRRIADELRRHKQELATLIATETGKIRSEAEGEVQEMIDIADFAVGLSRMLYGRSMHSERPQHRLGEQWHPLGLVGVITAFNFPAAVWAWNAFIAAVAGNAVVWKPSPKAPLTAIAIQHIVNRVMLDAGFPGVFSMFVADTAVTENFVADPRVAQLSFTGSSAVGRKVAQIVAYRMGRCLLECSGNNAVIIDESANLDLALRAVLFGAVGTAGQRCTSTRRLIVHDTCFDEVATRLTHAYQQISVGDPLLVTTLMGPLIDEQARQNFLSAVAHLKAAGGAVLTGGAALNRPGYFVEPTLALAENHWDIVQRETFGPLLYVMRCHDIEEAVALNNSVPQGLSSSLFTENLRRAEYFLSAAGSDCGIANINVGTSGAEIGGAFGGEKETGGGREAGSDAWKNYMRRQTNTINWGEDMPLAQGVRFGLD
jgi:aldehyde dehydrogenase (NAD+)